ncbi:serine/threonine protein phosphatase 1 [Bradyrhizobium sp. AZCC 1588]|uniref:metallophosphoesterase n=1 Tax=unclassified Bradyrhizobium TaxID=2631580 RepID=UPI002FF41640
MSRTYAIPDLHGRLDLLDRAIDAIARHAEGVASTIITLGDYVDRGPQSRQVVERLMNWRSSESKVVNLKGNHEAMMWAVCENRAELDWWIKNGGGETLASYDQSPMLPDLRAIPASHLDWIANLPLMHVDRHRVFVHAAVDPRIPLDQQSEQTLLWKRYPEGFNLGHGRRYVVHGHHADPRAPVVTTGKTNLDALAWKTGRLVIGVFEDDRPGGALDFLEVLGPAD